MSLADRVADVPVAWPLNEASGTRADQVGSLDLTDNNTVGSGTGKVNATCADFELSSGEFLSHADHATLDTGDIDFMVRLWVNLESKSTVQDLIGKWDGVDGYLLLYNSGTDRFEFYARTGGVTGSVQANNLGAVSTGTWYLIHAWHDAVNNQVGIAVNAGTADTVSYSTGVGVNSEDFRLGTRNGFDTFFDGLMDDPLIMTGAFLDATERTADYNSGNGVAFADWGAGGSSVSPVWHRRRERQQQQIKEPSFEHSW